MLRLGVRKYPVDNVAKGLLFCEPDTLLEFVEHNDCFSSEVWSTLVSAMVNAHSFQKVYATFDSARHKECTSGIFRFHWQYRELAVHKLSALGEEVSIKATD